MGPEDLCYFHPDEEPDENARRLTNLVIGACIEVHKRLGAGYGESIYQRSLAVELRERGISFDEQVAIAIDYKGTLVGEQRLDFLVESALILEIKAVEEMSSLHVAQLVS